MHTTQFQLMWASQAHPCPIRVNQGKGGLRGPLINFLDKLHKKKVQFFRESQNKRERTLRPLPETALKTDKLGN